MTLNYFDRKIIVPVIDVVLILDANSSNRLIIDFKVFIDDFQDNKDLGEEAFDTLSGERIILVYKSLKKISRKIHEGAPI